MILAGVKCQYLVGEFLADHCCRHSHLLCCTAAFLSFCFACNSGPVLFLFQDSHQCCNVTRCSAWDYEWQRNGISRHDQHSTAVQPLSWSMYVMLSLRLRSRRSWPACYLSLCLSVSMISRAIEQLWWIFVNLRNELVLVSESSISFALTSIRIKPFFMDRGVICLEFWVNAEAEPEHLVGGK